MNERKKFQAYLYHTKWEQINLGASIDLSLPNIEIHLPFCFMRIGWSKVFDDSVIGWRFGAGYYKSSAIRIMNGHRHNFTIGWAEL